MTAPDPEEYRKFHEGLIFDHPDFKPHYIELPIGRKSPPNKGWKENSLSFEEAYSLMKEGHNIGLGAMTEDALAILDIDWKGVDMGITVKRTLSTTSRKRHGGTGHHFYWWADKRTKHNVAVDDPDNKDKHMGELRVDDYYVVAAGSYVLPDEDEWFGTKSDFDELKEKPKPGIKVYILTEAELKLLGHYTLNEQHHVMELTVAELPECFRAVFDKKFPDKSAGKTAGKTTGTNLYDLTFEHVFKGKGIGLEVLRGEHPDIRGPSPFHAGKDNTQFSKWTTQKGKEIVIMKCWRHACNHSPLSSLGVLAGLGSCNDLGKPEGAGDDYVPQLNLNDDDVCSKLLTYAKETGILPESAKKRGRREKKEEIKCVGFATVGSVVYRQCRDPFRFARFDKATKTLTYVDKIPETDEYPYTLAGITHPKELKSYGTALDLYRKLKAWWRKVYTGNDEDHTALSLYTMYHGTLEPFKHKSPQIHPRGRTGSGKGAIEEGYIVVGDRARKTTDLKLPTAYRMNNALRGGLEILDEQEDRKDVENYARAKYDPRTWQHRIVKPGEPNAPDAICAFASPGPCIVSSRIPFSDNATPDRGIVIHTAKQKEFALEMTEEVVVEGDELLCELARFWSEHYGEISPSTKEELAYNRTTEEGREPRLVLAYRTFLKLAKIIGDEAEQDLKSFLVIQTAAMRLAKSETLDGQLINGFHHLLQSKSVVRTKRDGTTWVGTIGFQLHPAVQNPARRFAIIVTGEKKDKEDPRELPEIQGIGFDLIGKVTGIAFGDISKRLLEYGILRKQVREEYSTRQIRTLIFDVEILDSALAEFDPDYSAGWKTEIGVQTFLDRGA